MEMWSWGHVVEKATDGLEWFIRLCNVRFKRLEILLTQLRGAVFGLPVVYAHLMPGADWGEKVTAALAALPATGGIVDARGLTGTQTAAAEVAISADKVTLLLGTMSLTCALDWVYVTGDHCTIRGEGRTRSVVTCSTAWDGTNLFGCEVEDADGFTLLDTGLVVHRTGSSVHTATNGMAVYIHGTSRNWLVADNDVEASGTEPDSQMRYLGIFAWTDTAGPPIACGDGVIRGNRVRDTDGRCIEVALCDNVAIADNVVLPGGSAATIVCVGVRIIGSEQITVTGNTVDITGGASLGNADCLQINGDNVSTNIVLSGNACRTNANGGTGIKIGGNASFVTCVGNDVYYDGASTALYGILVTSNPGSPEDPPTHILVDGNRVSGFGSQLGIDREGGGDTYPDTVAFTNNQLGARFDGTATIVGFYNLNSVDIYANIILLHGNQVASTSLDTMVERFQGLVRAAAFEVGTAAAQQGSFRVANGSAAGLDARNAADSADVALVALTSSDHAFVGGSGVDRAGFSDGTLTAYMDDGHWRPGSDNAQDLGGSGLRWLKLWLAGEAEIDGALNHDGSTAGFFGVTPVSRAAALTQTYATADRTLGAYTADDESAAYTGIDNLQAGTVYATVADLNALRVAVENLRAFTEDVAQHHNAVVDDLQAYGLEQ